MDKIKQSLVSFKQLLQKTFSPETKNSLTNIFIIYQKELRNYFNSPIAYIVIIVFLLIGGWFFSAHIFLIKQATIEHFLINIPLLFVFIIPAVSMRLFSEELKVGTIKILTTLPVRDSEIIISKYLSAVTLITVAILATIIHPITVSFLGDLDWGQVIGSYIGLILLAASFVAIGLFASSLTRNQIIAFIIGLLICFVLFIIGKILILVPPFLVSIVEYLSIDSHFNNISKGLIDSRDIIYYLSMIFFFLAVTHIIVSSRREIKRLQVGIYSFSSILLLICIITVINYLSFNIFKRIDLTQGNIYSLSKASINFVKKLKDPVIVKAYFSENLPAPYNTQSKYLEDLLGEYKAYSGGKIKYKFIDPKDNQELLKEVRAIGIPPLRFTQIEKDKYEMKEGYMGIVFLYEDKKEVIPLVKETQGLEYDITSTIKKLTSKERKTIGFLTGHDESDILDSQEIHSLISSNYNVQKIQLYNEDKKETDASKLDNIDTLIILGPKKEIQEQEKLAIDQFLMKDKTVAFFIDKNSVDLSSFQATPLKTGLDDLLRQYGVQIEDGYVLDNQNQTIGITQRSGIFTMTNIVHYPFIPIATKFNKENLIVKDLEEITLPFISPLQISETNKNLKPTIIVESSPMSWHKNKVYTLNPLQKYFKDPNDKQGPLPLIAVVEGEFESMYPDKKDIIKNCKNSRIIVAGTSRFIDNSFNNRMNPNINFFLNTIDWLVQDEALISIRSKGITFRPLKELNTGTRLIIKYLNLFLMPLLFIIYGLYRWKSRTAFKNRLALMFQ